MKSKATLARDGVLPRSELASRLETRRFGKTLVFTCGCFDLIHVGHVRALEAARRLGDILVVGVNSDASVRGLKGETRPIVPEMQRAEMLAALKSVDYVVIFPESTPIETIRLLRPDVHVKSGDYRAEEIPEASHVLALGGRIEIVPLVAGLSSTNIVERIVNRHDDHLRRAG